MYNEKHKIIIYRNGIKKIDWLWFWREYQYVKDDIKWFKRRFFPVYCKPQWNEMLKEWTCKNCGYNIHVGKCKR